MAHEGEFDDIESAIEDIRQGKVVIVVDDEDRENEGDFLTAARNATPEVVNFMATHGRGLICAPLTEQRCAELGLDLMVRDNTALHETPFTVSVDVRGHGTTTGISAYDRAQTMRALIDPATVNNVWNEFLLPLIYLQSSEKFTLALGLRLFQGEAANSWHLLMAASLLTMLPVVALFFAAQKYFMQGIVFTGVKG